MICDILSGRQKRPRKVTHMIAIDVIFNILIYNCVAHKKDLNGISIQN